MNAVADDFGMTEQEQQFANAAPVGGFDEPAPVQAGDFGKKLKAQTMAVRLRRKKWGIVKKLERKQIEQTAEQFHAETNRLSAAKKLIDSKAKQFRNCISTINAAVAYWREMTVPYPEFGIRLMRKDRLDIFNQRLAALKAELLSYVADLKIGYNDLVEQSRDQLGELFNAGDYPTADALDALFDLEWEFPAIEPNSILKQLNPALYAQEQARIQARFDEAVKLAEEGFIEELKSLVANLANRLQVGDDGKPKMFRNEAVVGLSDFFKKFKEFNVGNNAELDKLVEQAQELVKGDPMALAKSLRKDVTLRQATQQSFFELSAKMDKALVSKPARKMFLDDDNEQ